MDRLKPVGHTTSSPASCRSTRAARLLEKPGGGREGGAATIGQWCVEELDSETPACTVEKSGKTG